MMPKFQNSLGSVVTVMCGSTEIWCRVPILSLHSYIGVVTGATHLLILFRVLRILLTRNFFLLQDKQKIFMAKYFCVRLHSLFGTALAAGLVVSRMFPKLSLSSTFGLS